MNKQDRNSRVDKFEKRRKNTKLLSILLVVGGVLILVLLIMFLFGGGNEEEQPNDQAKQTHKEKADKSSADEETNDSTDSEDEDTSEEPDEQESKDEDDDKVKTEQIETDDENVAEAYTGNWDPVGTEQQGAHTTNYDEGSQDRNEMEQAIVLATGLQEDNMTTWWVGRGGDQSVIATVSDTDGTKTYRTYLTWVDHEGWQPTKVEILKENDKKG